MTTQKIETLAEGRFLRLVKEGHWEYVERINSTGAVFILALTAQEEIVLVEQYRVPLQGMAIELPAGMVGDEAEFRDESLLESALRELDEETGFHGQRAELLMSGPVAPGLTSEILHLVQIHDIQRVHAGGGVGNEDIRVHLVPVREAAAWLSAQRAQGKFIEPRIYTALYLAGR